MTAAHKYCSVLICAALLFSCSGVDDKVIDAFESSQFQALHTQVLANAFSNLSVLPNDNFIVVDGIVINRYEKTFGRESEIFPSYSEYYKIAGNNHFESLDSLFAKEHIQISPKTALEIIYQMKQLGIGDITPEHGNVLYMWKMSAMWGSNGVVYIPLNKDETQVLNHFKMTKQLKEHFFYVDGRK